MKPADITHWLASAQEYAQGAALYEALGTSRTYKRLFALPPTPSSRQVLLRELQAMVPPAEPAPGPVAAPVVPSFTPHPAAEQGQPPAPSPTAAALLQQLRQRLRHVRDQRSQLHAQLEAPRLRQTDRFKIACSILDLTDQEQDLLSDQAYVNVHGRLPGPVPVADVLDAGELRKRLGNLLSNRTKLRRRAEKADQLASVEADILLIRQKLNS